MSEPANTNILSHSTPVTVALLLVLIGGGFGAGVAFTRLLSVEKSVEVLDARDVRIVEAIDLLKEVSTSNKRRLDEIDREREREQDRERNQDQQ